MRVVIKITQDIAKVRVMYLQFDGHNSKPSDREFDHGLHSPLQWAMLLAEDIDARIEQCVVPSIVGYLADGLDEFCGRGRVRSLLRQVLGFKSTERRDLSK